MFDAPRASPLPDDPSAFTTVIELDAYRGESKDIEEILGETVGVQVRRFGGPGDPSEISIRGSTSNQVVILLDGVRLNSAQTGGVDLSTIPVDLIERIEISRGGGSVSSGSDAIGGVVNLITKRPGGEPHTSAAFSGESFGTWTGSATQSGDWRGTGVSLGYSGFATDGDWEFQPVDSVVDGVVQPGPDGRFERINNENETHSAQVGIGRDLGDWGHVGLNESFFYASAGRPGSDLGSGPLLGQSETAHQRRTRNLASLLLELADWTRLDLDAELLAFHRFERSRFHDEPQIGRPAIDSDNRNHAIGARAGVSGDGSLGPTRHALSLDGELRYDLLFSPNQPDRDRRTLALGLQDEIRAFDARVRLIPALRVDATQGFDSEWIPRLGAIVRAWSWLEFKANVERSYRVPNFDELYFDEGDVRGNPNLRPEDALNADVGLELRFERLGPLGDLWLEFAVFRNDIDESIVFLVQPTGVAIASNTGPARIDGLELAGGFRLFGWIGLSANWTHLDAELKRTGNPLPGRADDEWFARCAIGPPDRLFEVVGEIAYRSSIPVSASGRTQLESGSERIYGLSAVVDVARLPGLERWIPGRHLRLSVAVKNLTDANRRDAQFFPQPGRTLAFRAEWEI